MERSHVLDAMGQLKLYGMKAAYDDVMATAVERQHDPQHVVSDLLNAEISEKQARSIKYQMTIAKLPLAKELDEFNFEPTPINETLVRNLAGGDFLDHQRNLVLIGGTGTGKTHLAVSIIGPVSATEQGDGSSMLSIWSTSWMPRRTPTGRPDRRSDLPSRFPDPRRTGLPAIRPDRRTTPVPFDQQTLRTHLDHRHHQSGIRRMAERLRGREDDDRSSRPAHPSL